MSRKHVSKNRQVSRIKVTSSFKLWCQYQLYLNLTSRITSGLCQDGEYIYVTSIHLLTLRTKADRFFLGTYLGRYSHCLSFRIF